MFYRFYELFYSITNNFLLFRFMASRCREHFVPQRYNRRWNIKFYNEYIKNREVEHFLSFYRERQGCQKRRTKRYATCYIE